MRSRDRLIYLDANATEPLRPEAREALMASLDHPGNPASVHRAGRAARHILEESRSRIAAAFGGRPQEVIFTSGATEANALAMTGLGATRSVLIGATEHDAVRAAAPGAEILPVDATGQLRLDALDEALASRPEALVAVMAANNETGVLHPLAEIGRICTSHQAVLHVDAAQSAGRVTLDYLALGAASIAVSSHKLGGPAGSGALVLAPAYAERLNPLIKGGGQERGRRGGTPDLPSIAGFGAAMTAISNIDASATRLVALREWIEAEAVAAGAVIIGAAAPRLANTTCLALPGFAAETQVIALDLDGICVSAGAACSSGKVTRSHVLTAMGLSDLASQAIRISLPWNADQAGIEHFLGSYRRLAARALRKPADFSTAAA